MQVQVASSTSMFGGPQSGDDEDYDDGNFNADDDDSDDEFYELGKTSGSRLMDRCVVVCIH